MNLGYLKEQRAALAFSAKEIADRDKQLAIMDAIDHAARIGDDEMIPDLQRKLDGMNVTMTLEQLFKTFAP